MKIEFRVRKDVITTYEMTNTIDIPNDLFEECAIGKEKDDLVMLLADIDLGCFSEELNMDSLDDAGTWELTAEFDDNFCVEDLEIIER